MLEVNTLIHGVAETVVLPITVVQRWKGKPLVILEEAVYTVSLKDEQEFDRQ